MEFQSVTQVKQSAMPHLGELVARRLDESGMTRAEFGRRLLTSRQNVNSLLRKPTMTAEQLMVVGIVLRYDFFAVLSKALHQAVPDCQSPVPRSMEYTHSHTHAQQLSTELLRAALAVVNCALPPPT